MSPERFSKDDLRTTLTDALPPQAASSAIATGIGYYRNLYRQFGKKAWDFEPAKTVRIFFEHEKPDLRGKSAIEFGAGTGKNIIEFVRQGIQRAMAVEIDSLAAAALIDTVIRLEEHGLVDEGVISVCKDDVRSYLSTTTERFDFAVAYGLLHVFRKPEEQQQLLQDICARVHPGGYAVLQSLTNKYPAPRTQPELEGITVTEDTLHDFFRENSKQWKIKYFDDADITHSHAGAEEEHRHGSVRMICQKT